MKAAVVYGENDIRIAEVPTPEPGPGEALVRVGGSGVCTTDVKILGGTGLPKKLPTILGHEVAGTIAVVGDGVGGDRVGDRVAVYPIAVCGECYFCRLGRHSLCVEQYGLAHGIDGGFAEYVLIPEPIVRQGGLLDIDDMPFDLAAMIEPVACCLSAAEGCGTSSGDNVLVIGCGLMGQLNILVSKRIGARVIAADLNDERLEKAESVGADFSLNPDEVDIFAEVKKLTVVGADIVIAAVGTAPVVEKYLPLVRNGGLFNIFGGTPRGQTITVDPRWLHYGEVVLTGTFAASLDLFAAAHGFVRDNAEVISELISVRCNLEGILDAVERVRNGEAFKTIITFD
ncbi:alcohol dehydrogenase catalytic domain-containing protein [candidate division KSB1 bacterium]